MKRTAVVTIASTNYFAQVQILMDSLAKTNPTWDRYFGVADEIDDELIKACRNRCEIIQMTELDIPDLDDMKFRYDIMELNTAIKPFVLLHLMKTYDRVIYMDPDICVYKELSAVNKAFDDGYEFVVTPHFTDYWEEDNKYPNEPDILMAGTYNFGFFAAANCEAAKQVISWWAKKLETLCVNKQAEGIFVDQKWMDLLPARHDKVYILRNHGYNIAYWNLSHRKVTYEDGEYYFNGDPLVFFHFSGYNPNDLDCLSKYQNRFSMDDMGAAKKLFYNYASEALDNGYTNWRKKVYAYNKFSDGRLVTDLFRRIYRDNQAIQERIGTRNPFDCADVFYDQKEWMSPFIINHVFGSNGHMEVYLLNTTREHWLEWFENACEKTYKLDREWVDYLVAFLRVHLSQFNGEQIIPDFEAIKPHIELRNGVNVIGYIRSEHGLGEACRLTAEALSTTSLEWSAYDWEVNNSSRQTDSTWDDKIRNNIMYNISIFNINADQMLVAKEGLPEEAWNGYRIGIWYWELSEFPDQWCKAFDLVDEIWAPTKFIQENLMKKATCPVIYMPPGLRREEPKPEYDRAYFGLPENTFLYLNFYDAYSFTNRKNPYAAIKAFQMAFKPDDMAVGLVLKVNNASAGSENIKTLEKAIAGYNNIYIIAKTITRDEVNALINICDVGVSLHRSEGLGLLCEESMYFGKPVIATNWSGNTDFMTDDSACLVSYSMIPVREYYCTNDMEQKWADPDVHHASEYMVRLFQDKDYYEKIARNAKEHIRTHFSPEVCGGRMKERIREIQMDTDKVTRYMLEKEAEAVESETVIVESQQISLEAETYATINEGWDIPYYHNLSSQASFAGLRVFVKRLVRKLCRGVMEPITIAQTRWNAAVVKAVNDLTEKSRIGVNDLRMLKDENEILKKEVVSLKRQLVAQRGEMAIMTERWEKETDKRIKVLENQLLEQREIFTLLVNNREPETKYHCPNSGKGI